MPGSAMLVLPTLIASDMVTKNQPPDMLIIMFQISGGSAEGRLDPPETCPGVQAEHAAGFLQFWRARCAATGRS